MNTEPTVLKVRLENVAPFTQLKPDLYNTRVGGTSPGPLAHGWSNDWFFGTTPEGIELFDAMGEPVTGDLSSMLHLYCAGTELSEEPGIGPNTERPAWLA